MLYFQVIYYVSSTVTKIAIAFTMLRLFQQKWVRWVIHINWVFMTLTAIGALAFVFARCQPFAANYNPLMYVSGLRELVLGKLVETYY